MIAGFDKLVKLESDVLILLGDTVVIEVVGFSIKDGGFERLWDLWISTRGVEQRVELMSKLPDTEEVGAGKFMAVTQCDLWDWSGNVTFVVGVSNTSGQALEFTVAVVTIALHWVDVWVANL